MVTASQTFVDIKKVFSIKTSKINNINNIFRNIKHIVNKCRQHLVTNILLSGLTTTDRLPRELIKNFKILIRNIYIVQHQIMVLQIKQIPR